MDGILLINKPEGKTSAFVDFVCKKILKIKKAGHLGTLDPFATGVLAIAINNGTKVIPYIKTKSKIYEFEIKFGEKTNTGDKTGEIIEQGGKIPSLSEIESILHQFKGEITQTPHAFSAVKINGKRAFEIARKGEIPDIKPKQVTIFDLELIENVSRETFKFRAEVSGGTYIRSLTEDIAKALGTFGYTLSLKRVKDGKFSIDQAITLDELREKSDNIESVLIPLEDVLDDIPVIFIACQDAIDLSMGRFVKADFVGSDGEYLVSNKQGFLAFANLVDGVIYPKRILTNLKG